MLLFNSILVELQKMKLIDNTQSMSFSDSYTLQIKGNSVVKTQWQNYTETKFKK